MSKLFLLFLSFVSLTASAADLKGLDASTLPSNTLSVAVSSTQAEPQTSIEVQTYETIQVGEQARWQELGPPVAVVTGLPSGFTVHRLAITPSQWNLGVGKHPIFMRATLKESGGASKFVDSPTLELEVAPTQLKWNLELPADEKLDAVKNAIRTGKESQGPTGSGFFTPKPDVVLQLPPPEAPRVLPPLTPEAINDRNWKITNNPLRPLDTFPDTLIYFATNRKPIPRPGKPSEPWRIFDGDFGPETPNNRLSYGAVVIESTLLNRPVGTLTGLKMKGLVGSYPYVPYPAEQNTAADNLLWWTWGQNPLVFVHGFNNSFEEIAIRAAQLKLDLQYPGPVIILDWLSVGSVFGYFVDKHYLTESVINPTTGKKDWPYLRQLADFFDILLRGDTNPLNRFVGPPGQVNVIAHSMGNFAFLNTLGVILLAEKRLHQKSFNKIFLAAPDVKPESFLQWVPNIVKAADRVTVYYSTKDLALRASELVHGAPRAGQALPWVDGIDAINSSFLGLGHIAYAASPLLLWDMQQVLYYGLAAEQRMQLLKRRHPTRSDWEIR